MACVRACAPPPYQPAARRPLPDAYVLRRDGRSGSLDMATAKRALE